MKIKTKKVIHKSICKRFVDGNETRQTIDLGITLSHNVSYEREEKNISFNHLFSNKSYIRWTGFSCISFHEIET